MKKVLKKRLLDEKSKFFLTKHKSSATLSEGALLKNDFSTFPFVLKGVVYWFIIIKICFIDNFHWNLKTIFCKFNQVVIKGVSTLEKLRSFQLFFVDYTEHIEVLWLVKLFLSKKLLRSVTNYYCDNRNICGTYIRCC